MLASGPRWTVVSTRHLPRAAPQGLNRTEEAGGRQHSLLSLGSDRAEGPDEPEVLVRGQLQGEGWGSAPRPQALSSLATAPPRPAQLPTTYLVGAHFGQLLQEDLYEVALHPVRGFTVRVQDLCR